jgi:3-hydroxybutyryl-CoA dehydrogenase
MTVQRLAVLGAGTMGHGIAGVGAAAGLDVVLFDVDPGALERGVAAVRGIYDKGVEKGKLSAADRDAALGRLRSSTDLARAVGDADMVIEAVPESMALKARVLGEVDALAPPEAILGTNTSSLSVTELAAATGRPTQVVGTHFFNPPHALRLLELVRAEQTSPETLAAARAAGERMGRELVVVNDAPGFATSRLGLVLGLEAMRMVQEGVATPEDIDRAMELGYRHPMGPLRLTDLVGLDVRLAIAEYLHRELGGEQFRPPPILRRMVRAGKLGKKSGQGFYRWD